MSMSLQVRDIYRDYTLDIPCFHPNFRHSNTKLTFYLLLDVHTNKTTKDFCIDFTYNTSRQRYQDSCTYCSIWEVGQVPLYTLPGPKEDTFSIRYILRMNLCSLVKRLLLLPNFILWTKND